MSDYILMPDDRWQIDKDPDASLIYGIDVKDILAPGDSLTGTPTCTVGAGGGLVAGAATFAGTTVYARISGGTVGQVVPVTWRWSTLGGDTDERTVHLRIVQR